MSDNSIFYVYIKSNNTYIQAKYLRVNGQFIQDPNLSSAEGTKIYADFSGQTLLQNSNGYLIVPADYNISSAIAEGQAIAIAGSFAPGADLIRMAYDFWHGGPEELQRTYDGVTDGPFVSAFQDAASFNLGVVAQTAGIPLTATLFAGGMYNHYVAEGFNQDGMYYNNAPNVFSIIDGYITASTLNGSTQSAPQGTTDSNGNTTIDFYNPSNSSQLSVQDFLNQNGTSQINFYNPANNDALAAQQFLNADGSGSVTADGVTFSYGTGNTAGVSIGTKGDALVNVSSSSSSTGLAEQIDITSAGASVLDGGNVVASAPAGVPVTDGASGTLSFVTTPVTGVTESEFLNPAGAPSELLQGTNSTGSFTIQESDNSTTGFLAPTAATVDGVAWNPTLTPFSSYLNTTATSVDTSDASSAQTQTQSTINAENTAIDSGNTSSLSPDLLSIVNYLIGDEETDNTDATTTQAEIDNGTYVDATANLSVASDGGSAGSDNPSSGDTSGSSGDTGGGGGDTGGGDYSGDPLVFSLTGQGINLESFGQSNASYSFTGSGAPTHTGWVGAGTGILVLGSSAAQVETFSALAALDTNKDGVISANDTTFSQLQVWNDANGNGVVDWESLKLCLRRALLRSAWPRHLQRSMSAATS